MLDHDPQAMLAGTGAIMSLYALITRGCNISGLDEYELWRLVERGMVSYWQQGGRKKGLAKDDVVELKRAAKEENGWYVDSSFTPMDEWLERYRTWTP
jgi:hypothetical protein